MKPLKKISILMLFILNLSIVLAANNYNFNFYDAKTNATVNSVESLFYKCNVAGCADNIEPSRFAQSNSGQLNSVSQNYLGTPNPQDYMAEFLAQCYLPMTAVTIGDWGTGQSASFNIMFPKGQSCHAPIYQYTVLNSVHVNEPLQINIIATLDARTSSAFKRSGFPPLFIPAGYENYFSAQTQVFLEIRNGAGSIVNSQSETVEIPVDTNIPVHFEWTPRVPGNYTARITTSVTDCQCQNETDEFVQANFTVLQNRPQNQCYTILNNLTSSDQFPFINQSLALSVFKTSNFANGTGTLAPLPTTLTWTITNLNTTHATILTSNVNANPDAINPVQVTKAWNPEEAGQYLINVFGIANDARCFGIENIPMTTQMTIISAQNPTVCTDVDHDGFSEEGGSCGPKDCADTNPNIYPGAPEICNGVDDNCNGLIDEGIVCPVVNCTDNDHDGFSSPGGSCGPIDCNDNNALIHPGAAEICNGVDDNCNGLIDEGGVCPVVNCTDNDHDSFSPTGGVCGPVDCNDNNASIYPFATEICNGVDDNCNGLIDEGGVCPVVNCTDNDHDSFSPTGGACGPVDCNDNNALIHPGAIELCNGIDDNCDGLIDNNPICMQNLSISISASPTSGSPPLQVFFTTQIISGVGPFRYFWSFGDNDYSFVANPVHVFYDEKIFTPTVIVTDAYGTNATASLTISTKTNKSEESVLSRGSIFISTYDVISNDIKPGDTVEIITGFKNIEGRKLNDATITLSIPELGIFYNAKSGKLKNNEIANENFVIQIPSWAHPGYYNVRLSFDADSSQVKRVEYRQIKIN